MAIATSNVIIQYGTPSSSWGTISHYGLWTAATGGTFLGSSSLTTSRSVATGADAEFPSGDFTVTVPRGELSNAGARLALAGVTGTTSSTTRYVSLHTSSPGTAGTTGEVSTSSTGYAREGIDGDEYTISD